MKLKYLLLDVFTSEPYNGNPLAVVCDGDGLLDNEMQAIASEFNLSETVFLTRPRSERNTACVRIFTPTMELGFAGHPTVGAALILGQQHKVPVVRIEERIGTITALVEKKDDKGAASARFGLPRLPEEAGTAPDRHDIALALGVMPGDIGCGLYRPSVVTAGVLFYLVPVRNAKVLQSVQPERRGWADVFPLGQNSVYVFTETTDEPDNHFAARMFSPGMGLTEDPGTGSAAAALIGLVARHASFSDGQEEFFVRQGHEMGRPCRIAIQVRKEAGELTHGGIGGQVVIVGEGELRMAR
jgi:trans-2,3-dihydro-3-hydroxyanthranilate isomerase